MITLLSKLKKEQLENLKKFDKAKSISDREIYTVNYNKINYMINKIQDNRKGIIEDIIDSLDNLIDPQDEEVIKSRLKSLFE